MKGSVESIHVAPTGGVPMQARDEVQLVAGRGIVGDRYSEGAGEFSPEEQEPDHELTLIEAEEVERFNREAAVDLEPGQLRRNVVTRGVRLNDLVGVEFSLGETRLRGMRLCEPCRYLAENVHPQVVQGLVHRAGLRAAILRGGTLRVGDVLEAVAAGGAGLG
jgi:MOSC domain-containing protein YiiM